MVYDSYIKEMFIKIPDEYLDQSIYEEHPHILTLYLMIKQNQNWLQPDISSFSIGDLFDIYGINKKPNKPKIYFEILKTLKYFEINNYITPLNFSIEDEPSYNKHLSIKLNGHFQHPDEYVKMSFNVYSALVEISKNNKLNLDHIIQVYLFILYTCQTTKLKECSYSIKNIAERTLCKNINNVKQILSYLLLPTINHSNILNRKKSKKFPDVYAYTLNESFFNESSVINLKNNHAQSQQNNLLNEDSENNNSNDILENNNIEGKINTLDESIEKDNSYKIKNNIQENNQDNNEDNNNENNSIDNIHDDEWDSIWDD